MYCITQLYVGRDMYGIYYIKNYMFRRFALAVFRLRNEKWNFTSHLPTVYSTRKSSIAAY